MTRHRLAATLVVAAAVAAAITTGTWAAARGQDAPPGMMSIGYGAGMMGGNAMMNKGMTGGAGMMGGAYRVAGDGHRVDSLGAARRRAQVFADRLGLRVGEVMQFSNGFYAELLTPEAQGATEVLVDAADGGTAVEYGPAMMWNTRYGMHAGVAAGPAGMQAAEATTIAQRWLDDQRPGLTTGDPERFPGYFTLHTLRNGTIDGMMSVNAVTGRVWYHTWHGQFIAMSEG